MANSEVMARLLVDAETMRIAANMMIASGADSLSDGSRLTMEVWDSWDEKEQRALVCNFLCEHWDGLSSDEQASALSKMAQECHRCGKRGGNGVYLAPDAHWGYTRLQCSDCALAYLLQPTSAEDEQMRVRVRPHPEWGWDPKPSAPVRIHGLAARDDLNGQTGKLISFDEPSGRWGLRVDGTGECVRVRPANFVFHHILKFQLPLDGSTTVRDLREQVKGQLAPKRMVSQVSLWLSSPALARMEVDYADERGVWRPKRLRDYGVQGSSVESRDLLVLISPLEKNASGVPVELDPSSDHSRSRVWPSHMSHAEKEKAHAELFGEDGRYGGPPYHPDVTPVGSTNGAF